MGTQLVMQTLKNRNMEICSQIARSAGITEDKTIKALLILEQQGFVAQRNGYWWLTPSGEKAALSINDF
ncbi:hypothetical protein CJP72_21845 [Citrobacter sp. NCU1]|uniref:hypothetical protein n=1 Tax=Citrobacter sp. NCU1 TaxID=2026683 RepID=UPI001390D024|nr:hypothetical protein [Citrobacter sp. NCU1]NDO83302.1 hypothetical protein [Citrobacter sp. NCU1]